MICKKTGLCSPVFFYSKVVTVLSSEPKPRILASIARAVRFGQPVLLIRWLIWLLTAMGWRNTPRSFAEQCRHNEDRFWSGRLDGTNYELKKPSLAEAMEFAWERCPSELYARVGHLPFGCHAWEKYEYDAFWHQYIV